jgi:hypothetical protein
VHLGRVGPKASVTCPIRYACGLAFLWVNVSSGESGRKPASLYRLPAARSHEVVESLSGNASRGRQGYIV